MKCPKCGYEASLRTPDYGYGKGAEFACYNHGCADRFGPFRFMSSSRDALKESDDARARSKANADKLKVTNH